MAKFLVYPLMHGVYISQLIRFVRISSHLADFKTRNKTLIAKFFNRDIGIINLGKFFEVLSPTLRIGL